MVIDFSWKGIFVCTGLHFGSSESWMWAGTKSPGQSWSLVIITVESTHTAVLRDKKGSSHALSYQLFRLRKEGCVCAESRIHLQNVESCIVLLWLCLCIRAEHFPSFTEGCEITEFKQGHLYYHPGADKWKLLLIPPPAHRLLPQPANAQTLSQLPFCLNWTSLQLLFFIPCRMHHCQWHVSSMIVVQNSGLWIYCTFQYNKKYCTAYSVIIV